MEDLYKFMNWGDYNQRIEELASMALPEQWSFTGKNDNGILKNYMAYTFDRLKTEGKIYISDDICVFNTGLFTPYYESICVCAETKSTKDDRYWKFRGFMTDYDIGLLGIKDVPERADYFYDPSLLVFNCNLPIIIQYRHILDDSENRKRLPGFVVDSDMPINILKGTIDTAIKRVIANYKLAVPQYFNGKIQLLIPLYFSSYDRPDIALVVTRYDEGFYLGHTCISLEMAYNNARLIARPDSNWLIP